MLYKIEYVLDANGTLTGREVCTTDQISVTTLSGLQYAVDAIANATQPFRSVLAMVTGSSLDGDGELVLPENRGLNIYVDSGSDDNDNAACSGITFIVRNAAELLIHNLDFTDSSSVIVEDGGEAVLKSCSIEMNSLSTPFLFNSGEVWISSTEIGDETRLSNEAGTLYLTYTDFEGRSSIVNNATLEVSQCEWYEEFELPGVQYEGEGSRRMLSSVETGILELPDAERTYR